MTELPKKLDRLFLKLDRAALSVEQCLSDLLFAIYGQNPDDAQAIVDDVTSTAVKWKSSVNVSASWLYINPRRAI